MKPNTKPTTGAEATLQDVLDRLATTDVAESRRRDLRSAVTSYAKLVDKEPVAIPLDLAALRRTLDRLVPVEAKISAKR